MLLTGQHPFKNHVYANVSSKSAPNGVELETDAICLLDVLKANFYN
jgi:hypothetical protein